MNKQKMREEFEKWREEFGPEESDSKLWTLAAWQAACASKQADCSRSHPHENMTVTCELRTEIARLTNQLANTESNLLEEQRISTMRGQHIEQRWAEISALSSEREELAAQVEVMREVLIEANNRIQQRQFIGGLVENIEKALSITPFEALAQRDVEVAAKALDDAADWFESSPEANPFSTRDILRNKAAAIRRLK